MAMAAKRLVCDGSDVDYEALPSAFASNGMAFRSWSMYLVVAPLTPIPETEYPSLPGEDSAVTLNPSVPSSTPSGYSRCPGQTVAAWEPSICRPAARMRLANGICRRWPVDPRGPSVRNTAGRNTQTADIRRSCTQRATRRPLPVDL